jgi:uncharacterized protein YukE
MPVHAEGKEIVAFAMFLDGVVRELKKHSGALDGQVQRLSTTWNDPAFNEFKGKFGHSKAEMDRFLAEAQKYSAFLHRKGQAVIKAEQQR